MVVYFQMGEYRMTSYICVCGSVTKQTIKKEYYLPFTLTYYDDTNNNKNSSVNITWENVNLTKRR